MDKWLSKKETRDMLGISDMTLCRYMKAGRIPYYKTSEYKSARVRFKESDVLKLLESFRRN